MKVLQKSIMFLIICFYSVIFISANNNNHTTHGCEVGGSVIGNIEFLKLDIYVYKPGNWDYEEIERGSHLNIVAIAEFDDDNKSYKISYLPAGIYDFIVIAYDENENSKVVKILEHVLIFNCKSVQMDIFLQSNNLIYNTMCQYSCRLTKGDKIWDIRGNFRLGF